MRQKRKRIGETELDRQEKKRHREEIAKWLNGILADNPSLTPTRWSIDAGVTRATVGRALDQKHDNVLSVVVLYKLAKAVGAPPPLDLGIGAPGVPDPLILAAIMKGLFSRIAPDKKFSDGALLAISQALRLALAEAAENPDLVNDPQSAALLGRMAVLHRKAPKNNPDKT